MTTTNEKAKSLTIDVSDDPAVKRTYSNHLIVNTSGLDCNLTFCHIDPLKASGGRIKADVVAKIVVPNGMVEQILSAININYNNAMKKMQEKRK